MNMHDYPEQLELDLDIKWPEYDEDTICTEFVLTVVYGRDLNPAELNYVWDLLLDELQEKFPFEVAGGHTRRGTDRELYPEDYNESKESDQSEKD